MEAIACKIVQYIEEVYKLETPRKEILQFGIQAFCEIGINILSSFLILYLMGMIREGIFFFLVFIPVRIYSGGYHSDTYLRCFILSCLTLIGVLIVSTRVVISNVLSVLLIVALALLIWREGPVLSENRPVSYKEYQKFLKRLKIVLVLEIVTGLVLCKTQAKCYLNILLLSLFLIFVTLIIGRMKFKQSQF